ncbi:MAG: ATP-binding protein [Actinomycetota bacterium]
MTLFGLGLLGVLIGTHGVELGRGPYGAAGFWLFSALLVVAELFPIGVQRDDEVDEITTSTTFAFALAIAYGPVPAALALVAGSVIGDVARRKPMWKTAFNASQYAISVIAAGVVYGYLASGPPHGPEALLPLFASAATFFFLNTILPGVGLALVNGGPLVRQVAHDFLFQAYTAPALLALSPILLFAADQSLAFVPLIVIPIGAVYWGANAALENVRLVERLQINLARAKELNRMKDDFVAVVSHELRTPLTSIQGYIKTVLQLGDELEPGQREAFLEAADRQSERLRRLIEQTLIVARLESHVEPLTLHEVAVQSLVDVVVHELSPIGHGHTFDVRVPADLDPVRTDEGKVHQILSNLVENALKYSPPDTRITIRGEPGVNGILVAVEDEGPGIPEEERDRVFDRFYQVDGTATRQVGGTGLGLYICAKLAEEIGARLWLETTDRPRGSMFCLFLPGSAAPPRARDAGDPQAIADPPGGRRDGSDGPDEPGQSITASV